MIVMIALVPLVPLSCLAMVLYLDHLEETLHRDVKRQRRPRWRPSAALSSAEPEDASPSPVPAGGSTNL